MQSNMVPSANNKTGSDDEEDLDLLRLAALQSLNKVIPVPAPVNKMKGGPAVGMGRMGYGVKGGGRGKWARGFGHHYGSKMNYVRPSNLITVPTIDTDSADTVPKLVLPQHRYAAPRPILEAKSTEQTSKFDRYDNSESDSETEDDEDSEKLQRSDSLEALMQELEKEIEGKIEETTAEEPKADTEPEEKEEVVGDLEGDKESAGSEIKKVTDKVIKEEGDGDQVGDGKMACEKDSSVEQKEKKLDEASEQKIRPPKPQRPPSYRTPDSPPFLPYSNPPAPINVLDSRVPVIKAPLSPRSLAFVLENHQIIERRKRSPRRSYSRSPSPLYRRSRSRSRTPLSPKRRKPTPPAGPRPRVSERRRKSPPKQRSRKRSPSRSPKPERQKTPLPPPADPVLEARRKKFESSVLPTAGIIRLKTNKDESLSPPSQTTTKTDDHEHQDEPDDELALDLNVADLFSDEESDDENEGRFKGTTAADRSSKPRVAGVLSFSKLINGPSSRPPPTAGAAQKMPLDRRKDDRHKDRKRIPLTTPIEAKKIDIKIKNYDKYKEERDVKREAKKEEREAKKEMREAKKEEREVKKEAKKAARRVEVAKVVRVDENLPLALDEPEIIINDEEVASMNQAHVGDLRMQLSRKRAAKLGTAAPSARRKVVPTRLLQTAFESAIFKKSKSKKRNKETLITAAILLDFEPPITPLHVCRVKNLHLLTENVKLPIHLRLGLATDGADPVVMEVSKKQKRSKRQKEQV